MTSTQVHVFVDEEKHLGFANLYRVFAELANHLKQTRQCEFPNVLAR